MTFDPRLGRRTSGLQYFSRYLLASAAVVALVLGQGANANPVGGTVTSGKATVSSPSAGTLQIDQSTKIVIINWSSFNIASGETTKFVQPGASSVAVNRIGGNDPSQILGSLLANGKVVLINGNGILFGKGATVNVGSLIATTSDAPDADIASGKATFDKAGNPNAQIINQGTITATTGGMVGLIAPAVSNSGVIAAKLGTVTLGASNVFTVDFNGDGLVSFPVVGNVVAAAIGKNGKPVEALVVNDGKITGGTVMLTARAAANLVTNVISMKGEIVATSAHQVGGKVVLDGGDSGVVSVSGKLDASAAANGNGGAITVVGQTTHFNGSATAKGGSQSGDGGQIETSGHVLDVLGAKIDTSAAHGATGTWTLDPYNVTISTGSSVTDTCSAGACTPTGNNSVLNVTTLQTALATSNVAVTTGSAGSQAGDITVLSPLTWSAHKLTLNAYHSINIKAAVSATGTAGLTLKTNDGGSGGDYYFKGGNISFANTSEVLTINSQAYKLLNSMSAVQNINASDTALQGHYALAKSLNASSTSGWVPIGTDSAGNVGNSNHGFAGVFTGLGHTISNLTVDAGSHACAGLFGYSSGTIRDIGMVGGSVSGSGDVGGLVGWNGGTISNAYATGSVSGHVQVGGLVGESRGTISNAYATGAVTGGSGSEYVGGLVGENRFGGTISNVYATGAVSGGNNVGGLVGSNYDGTVSNAYATGAVSGGSYYVGGLAGFNGDTISNAYATGAVSAIGNFVGGLVGYNNYGTTITNAFATGAVSGGSDVGGLVGDNYATLNNAYATGEVGGSEYVGGLVGNNDSGAIANGYWDTQTSGQSTGLGADNNSQSGHVKVKTTAQLQGTLPSGFSSATWGTGTGLFPYFKWQYPTTPQAVSGFAYSNAGVTPLASTASGAVTVSALVNGTNRGNATTGANGYYYLVVPHGTFSGTQQLLTYLNGAAVKANTYIRWPTGSVTNANLYGGTLRLLSGASTTSAMFTGLSIALGSNTGSNFLYTGGNLVSGKSLDIESSSSSGLVIDRALNTGTGKFILNAAGKITESSGGVITAATLTGSSHGAVTLNAANTITKLGAFTTNNNAFALTDANALSITGAINAGTGTLKLKTTSGNLTLKALVTAGTTTLISAAQALESGAGAIHTTTLNVTAHTGINLPGPNVITTIGTNHTDSGPDIINH